MFPRTDQKWLASQCGPTIVKRGTYLQRMGNVREVYASENGISGKVLGTQGDLYKVHASQHGNHLQSSCTCPFDWGPVCKHVVALILQYWQNPHQIKTSPPEEDENEPDDRQILASLKKIQQDLNPQKIAEPLRFEIFWTNLNTTYQAFGLRIFRKDKNKPIREVHDYLRVNRCPLPEQNLLQALNQLQVDSLEDGSWIIHNPSYHQIFSLLSQCEDVVYWDRSNNRFHSFEILNTPTNPAFTIEQPEPFKLIIKLQSKNSGHEPTTFSYLLADNPYYWLITQNQALPVYFHSVLTLFQNHHQDGQVVLTGISVIEFFHRVLPLLKNNLIIDNLDELTIPELKKESVVLEITPKTENEFCTLNLNFKYASGKSFSFQEKKSEEDLTMYQGSDNNWYERDVEKEQKLKNTFSSLLTTPQQYKTFLYGREYLNLAKKISQEKPEGIVLHREANSKLTYQGELEWNFEIMDQDEDWFEIKPTFIAERQKLSDKEFYKLFRQRDASEFFGYWGNSQKGYYSYAEDEINHLDSVFHSQFKGENPGTYRLPLYQLFSLYVVLKQKNKQHQLPAPLYNKIDKWQEYLVNPDAGLPKKFDGQLRSYQEFGYRWLFALNQAGLGGILADDMGLGKTVQTLALLSKVTKKDKNKKPHLIIAPTSVVPQWREEAKRFTPHLKVATIERGEREIKKAFRADIIITSYTLIAFNKQLQENSYDYCVLDEAQMIKNPQTTRAQICKKIQSAHRLALSGTPIENRLLELWSIFDFLLPGFLGNRSYFKSNFENPIEKYGNNGAHPNGAQELLQKKIRPFFLRRTKNEVEKDLPEKTEEYLFCDLTSKQKALYAEIVAQVREKVFEAIGKKGIQKSKIEILTALLRLRQVCCHTALIQKGKEGDSSKLDLLMEIMEQLVAEGHKALVFSQFVGMLHIVRESIETKKWQYNYLDGSTINRQTVINQFQTDKNIPFFLLSLKAGGFGLNLTEADYVIHYDPWWNPAVENQATDRAHRIGQKNKVIVYKLIAKDTIEEKILSMQKRKQKLSDAFINSEQGFVRSLTKDNLNELFSLPT